jgi:hypothetical protein
MEGGRTINNETACIGPGTIHGSETVHLEWFRQKSLHLYTNGEQSRSGISQHSALSRKAGQLVSKSLKCQAAGAKGSL